MSGPAEDGRVIEIGMQDQKRAGQKASHAVAEEHIGQVRKLFCHLLPELFHILDDIVPAAFLGKNTLFLQACNGLAVTEMVVSDGDKTVFRQKAHEVLIAVDVLGNTVRDLDDASGGPIRCADSGVNLVLTRRGLIIEIPEFRHGFFSSPMI